MAEKAGLNVTPAVAPEPFHHPGALPSFRDLTHVCHFLKPSSCQQPTRCSQFQFKLSKETRKQRQNIGIYYSPKHLAKLKKSFLRFFYSSLLLMILIRIKKVKGKKVQVIGFSSVGENGWMKLGQTRSQL